MPAAPITLPVAASIAPAAEWAIASAGAEATHPRLAAGDPFPRPSLASGIPLHLQLLELLEQMRFRVDRLVGRACRAQGSLDAESAVFQGDPA